MNMRQGERGVRVVGGRSRGTMGWHIARYGSVLKRGCGWGCHGITDTRVHAVLVHMPRPPPKGGTMNGIADNTQRGRLRH